MWGFTLGVLKSFTGFTFAALGVAYSPLTKPISTAPIYPTFSQVIKYARFKFSERYGWRSWWYRFSRRNFSILPTTKAVRVSLRKQRERATNRFLTLHLDPHLAWVQERPEIITAINEPSPGLGKTVKMTFYKYQRQFVKWWEEHPVRLEADVYRMKEGLPRGKWLPLSFYARALYPRYFRPPVRAISILTKHMILRYALKHAKVAARQAPIFFALAKGWFWLSSYLLHPLGFDRGFTYLATFAISYQSHMWFWGYKRFIPKFHLSRTVVLKFLTFLMASYIVDGIILACEGQPTPKQLEEWKNFTFLSESLRNGTLNLHTLMLKVYSQIERFKEEMTKFRRENKRDPFRFKMGDYIGKKAYFPGEGWDPGYLNVWDGEEMRKVKSGREFLKWAKANEVLGSLKTWEELEDILQVYYDEVRDR
eukprot:TRINITY_DN1857_c0_g1_i8.p1 TRINITY_DN1857_c0_g1~~TRINITY_DN1857_c0_g1_i8.p1  ORF type:complete len:423 (+),score=49.24 TRINITY_DN1857_c0_g1_i8:510-1778(+)